MKCTSKIKLVTLAIVFMYMYIYMHVHTYSITHYTGKAAIAIVADEEQLYTLGKAALETWAAQRSSFDIYFFVGADTTIDTYSKNTECLSKCVRYKHIDVEEFSSYCIFNTTVTNSNMSSRGPIIVKVNSNNEYPPIKKIFTLWAYFYNEHINKYDLFIKVDADSYVNMKLLTKNLNILKRKKNLNYYVGYPGTGIGTKVETLGINVPYCLGMGYIIGRNTLNKFGKHVHECGKYAFTNHSDTEVGRCVEQHSGEYCVEPHVPFKQLYYQIVDGMVTETTFDQKGRAVLSFPSRPPASMFRATMIHPIKDANKMRLFHEQSTKNIRPIMDPIRGCSKYIHKKLCTKAVEDTQQSCVNNPVLQKEKYPNFKLPECTFKFIYSNKPNIQNVPVFVVQTNEQEQSDEARLSSTYNVLERHNIQVHAIKHKNYTFKPSVKYKEIIYRKTVKSIIQSVAKRNIDRVFIIDYNVVLHCDFYNIIQKIIAEDRCGGYIFSDNANGVLILGYLKYLRKIDKNNALKIKSCNVNTNTATYAIRGGTQCFNIGSNNYGPLAVLMHKSVYTPILDWMELHDEPYDQVFKHLADMGYIVRAAYPGLVTQSISIPK